MCFLENIIDMFPELHSVSMGDIDDAMKSLHNQQMSFLVVLVHNPGCGHCQRYYPEFEKIQRELPQHFGNRGTAMAIDYEDTEGDLERDTESIPRVMLLLSNQDKDGTIKNIPVDEYHRNTSSLISLLEDYVPSKTQEDTPKEPKKEHKKEPKKKTKKGTKKVTKKREQKGRGFIESALAVAALGGAANIAQSSPMIKKYMKQVEHGMVGLSKASAKLAKGSVKVVTEQDMMKKLSNVTQMLTRRKKQKSTRKQRRNSGRRQSRRRR